ncbi:ATP-binding protein [Desulfitobacterium sp. THU1]|uniref:sensor histidine kinase n=1 Tax=Desulfitobacterium sp. THU1 TaxID=3138072 RepID=UPI00311FB876
MTAKSLPNQHNPHNRIRDRIRFSIVWKLNLRLLWRLLWIFLKLNVCLVLVSTLGLFIHAEQMIGTTAEKIAQSGAPSFESTDWLDLSGIRISSSFADAASNISTAADTPPDISTAATKTSKRFHIPRGLQPYFSPLTAAELRNIELPGSEGMRIWERIRNINYQVTMKSGENLYLISYHPQKTLQILIAMFAIVVLIELILLISSISSSARVIRQTLRPIQELAEAARNLTREGGFSPEQLQDLAGKLDDINATHLDTRIAVDETQSELKSLASAINGMLDRINESYRSQARFVSDASHELRTPISVIQGYANLLDRWGKKDEKTLQESIDAIKNETANMKALVEQLLFLARGDNNTMSLQMERFELSSLVDEVLRETQMIDGGHEYTSTITPVFILADKGLIKQATRILIDNAMKYTPTGKKISLSVSGEDSYARLTVQDEGIGIAPEAVPLIFDRFYRSDESRTRTTGGSGLGLAIARWIAERHGGHLEVLSRLDIGTRISLVLPKASEAV